MTGLFFAERSHCGTDCCLPLWGMRGVALSDETHKRLDAVFSVELRKEAEALLVQECGANLPFHQDASSEGLERVRFAALKMSGGTIDGLCEAIQEAQDDWRDLLLAADFAEDILAHKRWIP